MKQFTQIMLVLTLIAGFVFSGPRPKSKSEIKMTKMKYSEPDYRRGNNNDRVDCPFVYPTNPNSELTLIDSSSNGYGMWGAITRPMDVNSYGDMLVIYRQYAGENTTHGQLGAGYGVVQEDGPIQWDVQYNVNYNGSPPWGNPGGGGVGGIGSAQARYPSGIASEEYPYAIWGEYTGGPPTSPPWPAECSDYGGRPFFSYDEFGWGGESWEYPADLDPLYSCDKDLWYGSVGYGYDSATDQHHVSAVYDDWTRTGSYLFTSEAVVDGYIILGTETLVVNPAHLGTDGYSSAAILSMNDNGQGILGIDGIFAGAEPDAGACASVCGPPASNLTCNKVPMFKLTDNYGQSWAGNHAAYDFYYVPDAVFENGDNGIFDSWPNEVIIDNCTGDSEALCGYWSWYDFDMRVDNEGNPHIVISLLGETQNSLLTIPGKTGFYHLTIDRDMLANNHDDNPQWVNTPQGWNWSYIPLPANDSFDWTRPDGTLGYIYGAMCQISLSRDNPDIVYMVANIAETGPMSSVYDEDGDGVEDDACVFQDWPWELYPEWSEDIWVARSSDNGSTWTALENLSQTPRDIAAYPTQNQNCSPEEQLVHTAHWSDDERVYYQYQQPNWEWNEIGELLGADHMNRIFVGYSWVADTGVGGCIDPTVCNYCEDCGFDDGSCANVIGTVECEDGTSGCDCFGDCFTYIDQSLQVTDCNGNCGGGYVQACNATDGGEGDCIAGDDVCTQNTAIGCEDNDDDPSCTDDCDDPQLQPGGDVNSWSDCDGDFCGTNDPLFHPTGCADEGYIPCDGGRCYVCSDPAFFNYADCAAAGEVYAPATVNDCDQNDYPCADAVTGCEYDEFVNQGGVPGSCDGGATCSGEWIPFTYTGQVSQFAACIAEPNCEDAPVEGDHDECYCSAAGAEWNCVASCGAALGDLNGDGGFNVLDIVTLANCILAENCLVLENGCAGDLNGDGGWNVLDIVTLANCVLADNCGGRIDDASDASLIKKDNKLSFKANGFIGGVQMTLSHGSDFTIEMTDRALLADYLTTGNETRLLVISPETEELFSYNGKFEITEVIVANSQYEVSVDLPLAASFNLSDAYPNPFNPVTTMTLTMPVSGEITVEVYNLLGQVVATLASGYMEASTYTLTWDASNASSGVYFVQADAEGFTKTQKLMLVK
jgi:hypothetical protein